MAKIKILVNGYAKEKNGLEFASSTSVLIKEKEINIITDPGLDRKALLKSLKKEKLSPTEISYVVLTHYHLDHSLLAGTFKNAKILDNEATYSWDGKIENHKRKVPGTNIKIIKTPGHDMFHCSVLVEAEKFGKVAIVGDVFWWSDDEKQRTGRESLMKHKDPYVKNKEQLTESRKKVLQIADYIVPGHGKMFKVKNYEHPNKTFKTL